MVLGRGDFCFLADGIVTAEYDDKNLIGITVANNRNFTVNKQLQALKQIRNLLSVDVKALLARLRMSSLRGMTITKTCLFRSTNTSMV